MDLEGLSVGTFFDAAAEEVPDDPYLIWAEDGTTSTYGASGAKIDRAADAWRRLGVRRGDRVAFMVDNSPEFVHAWLGLAKAGGVLVAINTGFGAREAAYLVESSGSRIALVGAEHTAVFLEVEALTRGSGQVLSLGPSEVWESFDDAVTAAVPRPPDVRLSGDDLVSLIYTSGTTGDPKGVMQTHRNFVLTGQAYPHWMRMRRGQRIYACLPLFHINSQAYSTMGAIGIRGAMVLARRFSAGRFWPHIRTHGVSAFNFIGAMTVILSKSVPSDEDRSHQVHTAYGIPALAPDQREALERRFGMTIFSGFGMSETTFGLLEPLDQPRRPGSMGTPRHHPDPTVPRTEARIVDERGQDVPPGAVGELILRSPGMMAGYFGDAGRTREALRGGWLHTGDSAYQDDDGYFFFVDRRKDIVRRRGENVSSIEVERVVSAHPAVMEAAVVGVPSEFTDEDILAYVVASSGAGVTARELQDWCAGRLARFKVPSIIEFVDELPKTATAKVRKAELRERASRDRGR